MQKTQTVESLDVTKKDEKYQKHICGRRSLDHTELVTVRTEAKAGDWPWHVAILIKDNTNTTNNLSYYCGGNIVSKTAIVTGTSINKLVSSSFNIFFPLSSFD